MSQPTIDRPLPDARRYALVRAFNMIHEGLSSVRRATETDGDWPVDSPEVKEQVDKAEMVLAPIRRLRLMLDIPYEWTNGLQSTEKP